VKPSQEEKVGWWVRGVEWLVDAYPFDAIVTIGDDTVSRGLVEEGGGGGGPWF